MIGIVTALHTESRPLIDYYNLEKDLNSGSQPLFKGEGIILIESGIGKVRSAAAVAKLMHQDKPPAGLLNFGLCGSTRTAYPTGSLLFIKSILDHASSRPFYPDILWRHNLKEASLETFDFLITAEDGHNLATELVDMEASGFFEAASLYLPPSRIFCLKLVSDLLAPSEVSKSRISKLLSDKIHDVTRCIENFVEFGFGKSEQALSPELCLRLKKIEQVLRLTASQKIILRQKAAPLAEAEKVFLSILDSFTADLKTMPRNKREAKEAFKALLSVMQQGLRV